jgi:hypothetical protein
MDPLRWGEWGGWSVLAYLPARRLIRYLSTRTAAAITLPGYPEFPDPGPGSR